MKCLRCGKENMADALFCNRCGTATAPTMQHQAAMNPDRASALKLILWILAGFVVLGFISWNSGILRTNSESTSNTSSSINSNTNASALVVPPQPQPEIPPEKLREKLASNYKTTVAAANPYMNFIKSKLTKTKGGYALWAIHPMFTQSSFDVGSDAHMVRQWMAEHYDELKKAEIKRVGYKNESGYLGECWFDLK